MTFLTDKNSFKPYTLAGAMLSIAVLLAGCSANRFLDGKEHSLGEIALVTDVTVVNDRTLKPSLINVAEDMYIASGLEAAASNILSKKGYQPHPVISTVGFGFSAGKQPLEVMPDIRFATHQSPGMPPYGIWARTGMVNLPQLGELHNRPEGVRYILPDNSGRPLPVLVITARGKSASAGSMLTNVAKGAVNVVLSIGARDAVSVMEFDEDTVALNVSLIEGGSGKLLWQGARRVKEDPDGRHFVSELADILKKFPGAQSQAR